MGNFHYRSLRNLLGSHDNGAEEVMREAELSIRKLSQLVAELERKNAELGKSYGLLWLTARRVTLQYKFDDDTGEFCNAMDELCEITKIPLAGRE